MSFYSVTESVRIAEAYGRMNGGSSVSEGERGYKRIREYPVLANEGDEESAPYDASEDDLAESDYGECGDECHYTISECDGGETLYDSLIDGDVCGFLDGYCGRCGDDIRRELGPTGDILDRILKSARGCEPGRCVVIRLAKRLPIRITRLGFCGRPRGVEPVFEGVGDMTDEQFATWWNGLTPEQQEAEIGKLPDHIVSGELSDDEKAKLGMSDGDANLNALKNGAQTAALMMLFQKSGKKVGSKVAAKAGAKVATKAASKAAAKAAAKAGAKVAGKAALKNIPVLGALAGLGFGAGRLWGRDADGKLSISKLSNWGKAGAELASGVLGGLGCGAGNAASIAIDAGLAASDYKDSVRDAKIKDAQLKELEKQSNVSEGDEMPSVASQDSEYPIPTSELFEKKTYDSARKFIRKAVDPYVRGLFSDEDWSNVHRVFDAIGDLGVNLNYGTRNDGFYTHGYHQNDRGEPDSKAYEFEIKFTNVVGKKMKVCGQLIASGAGTVENPLSKYDIIFQLY